MKLLPLFFCTLLSATASHAAFAQANPTPAIAAIPYALDVRAARGAAPIADGVLTVSATKGTDLFAHPDGSQVTDDTPRVLFVPQGDFIFSAKVKAGFNKAFDGAALLVYAGKSTWGKLLFERMPDGSNAVSTTVAMGAGDDALHQKIDGDTVHLKIARKGGVYAFYLSSDGAAWRVLRAFALPSDQPVKVGFSAQSPLGERFTGSFSDVRWRAAGFKDYWQGE
jgi:regulation of enolase protein 1 (concanavalin A-like superfamily)